MDTDGSSGLMPIRELAICKRLELIYGMQRSLRYELRDFH